jgi:hypothetical protein
MGKGFPERRERDDALIAFIVDSLNNDDGERLKLQFALSDRNVEILDLRFRKQETYHNIGKVLHLTKERIRQILLEIYAGFRHPERRIVWDRDRGAANRRESRELSAVTLSETLLSVRAKKALFESGMYHLSDLVGKTRRELRFHHIDRTIFAEIEREIAEYGLAFRPTTGRKRDEIICRSEK